MSRLPSLAAFSSSLLARVPLLQSETRPRDDLKNIQMSSDILSTSCQFYLELDSAANPMLTLSPLRGFLGYSSSSLSWRLRSTPGGGARSWKKGVLR